MEIVKSQQDGKVVFTLTGRLDTNTAPEFQAALLSVFDGDKYVVLDFAGLEYISSAGLRVLLLGEKTAKMKDSAMSLINVREEIREVFEMTGFTDILKIV
ncbi:MAG: STAS domain-containing protein [Chitinispirillia bacterium]|nr:STAS domain-containing protein [Chitinispirillia bacterium]MCL2268972.1 STAS domain-containing protein [Chitinispirillia bacterium]